MSKSDTWNPVHYAYATAEGAESSGDPHAAKPRPAAAHESGIMIPL